MFKLFCVTNRKLSKDDFRTRLKKIAQSGADGIILREKDLDESEYFRLAKSVLSLPVPVILHTFVNCAIKLNAKEIHLPFPQFCAQAKQVRKHFSLIGVSCHSLEEARQAETLGANYLTAGHIFETDCKSGVPARGLSFLREICDGVQIPVYAIGGISSENIHFIAESGAEGACVMSGAMCCEDPKEYFLELRKSL